MSDILGYGEILAWDGTLIFTCMQCELRNGNCHKRGARDSCTAACVWENQRRCDIMDISTLVDPTRNYESTSVSDELQWGDMINSFVIPVSQNTTEGRMASLEETNQGTTRNHTPVKILLPRRSECEAEREQAAPEAAREHKRVCRGRVFGIRFVVTTYSFRLRAEVDYIAYSVSKLTRNQRLDAQCSRKER